MRRVDVKEFKKAMIEADYDSFVALETATGIDRASLSAIARGDRNPSWDTMASISDALHLSYDGIGRVFFCQELT